MIWQKRTPLVQEGETSKEVWIRTVEGSSAEYPVEISLGKKMDMTTLKKGIIETLPKQLDFYRKSRTKLYTEGELEDVNECMITGFPSRECKPVATIYGAEYIQSQDTGHVFVRRRPTEKSIHDFYSSNSSYSATYTDKASSEVRLQSIAAPWCEWMIKAYQKQYGQKPKRILDVGAGGGHFVEACRRAGLVAHGIELSEDSREFAKRTWGFEMDGSDFTAVYKDYLGYDIVTFWGLLEHTPNPKEILSCASQVVKESGKGLILSKLPRWNSLSAAVQRLNPDTIIRHIDPAGHIMLFSDASAAELYFQCEVRPTAAWYFGMDVYETLMQFGNYTKDYGAFVNSGKLQMELQQFVDEVRFSDNFVLAGVPNIGD